MRRGGLVAFVLLCACSSGSSKQAATSSATTTTVTTTTTANGNSAPTASGGSASSTTGFTSTANSATCNDAKGDLDDSGTPVTQPARLDLTSATLMRAADGGVEARLTMAGDVTADAGTNAHAWVLLTSNDNQVGYELRATYDDPAAPVFDVLPVGGEPSANSPPARGSLEGSTVVIAASPDQVSGLGGAFRWNAGAEGTGPADAYVADQCPDGNAADTVPFG